jgi:hypothetical protein
MSLASKLPPGGTAAGADVGTSLIKLALRDATGATRYEHLPAADLDRAAAHLHASQARRIGVTGGGAPLLERLLGSDTARIDEFAAWSAGARRMLRESGSAPGASCWGVGTGTSAAGRGGREARQGTLGGGTVLGLGRVLLGATGFQESARSPAGVIAAASIC